MPNYDKQRDKVQPPLVPLAALRAALGLTQSAVCERVTAITNKSFTKGALSAIEKGHRGASAETIRALETALGLTPASMVVGYSPSHARRKAELEIEEDAA